MKKRLYFVLLLSWCPGIVMFGKQMGVTVPTPASEPQITEPHITLSLSEAQSLRQRLMQKYQGKVNGIEQISRAVTDFAGIADSLVVNQIIDSAVNQLIGMGTVNIETVEKHIEDKIYEALKAIFEQSIALAAKTYRHEISHDLFPIAPWNKKIIWNQDQTHVLMLTWIFDTYKEAYEKALNNKEAMKISWDAWVTAVPEVKEFIKDYISTNKDGFNITDRVEQFLGLMPSKPPYALSQNKFFIEMWVRPEDLFRPCLDAGILGTECMIDPHEKDLKKFPPAFRDMTKLIPMTSEHSQWFKKEKENKYKGQWAMPWTRFGYTYDWGSLKKSMGKRAAKGATEYLIKSGSLVLIQSVIPTDEYATSLEPQSGYIYQE